MACQCSYRTFHNAYRVGNDWLVLVVHIPLEGDLGCVKWSFWDILRQNGKHSAYVQKGTYPTVCMYYKVLLFVSCL